MQFNLIISGVGGQGIITIANIAGMAAMEDGLYAKQSEIHGMSQRGGAVETHIRISNHPIFSDQIPLGTADMILSMEPLESLRHLSWLHKDGWLITHDEPVVNIPDYPDIHSIREEISRIPKHIIFNAENIARNSGSSRSVNIVLLGVAAYFLPPKPETFIHVIHDFFKGKEEKIIHSNISAFTNGLQYIGALLEKNTPG
jgi:indolepyruvate ferredoxin oxidoreductase beta subunit